jgi:hypothetical protein
VRVEEQGRGEPRGAITPTAEVRLRLELLHPSIGLAAFPLRDGDGVVLGRGGADVELGWDPQVSRRHVRVERRGEQLVVQDLGSKNGVWWRSARVERAIALGLDDELVVGDTIVRFAIAPDEDPFAEVTSGMAALAAPAPEHDSSDLRAPTLDLRVVTADLRLGLEELLRSPPTAPAAPAPALELATARGAPTPRAPSAPPSLTWATPLDDPSDLAAALGPSLRAEARSITGDVSPAAPFAGTTPRAEPRSITGDVSPAAPFAGTTPRGRASNTGAGVSALPSSATAADTLRPARGVGGPSVVERDGALVVEYTDAITFGAAYRKELAVGVLVLPTSARSPVGARIGVELRALGQRLALPMQLVQVLPPGAMGLSEGGLVLELVGLDREALRSLPRLDAPAGLETIARALGRPTGRDPGPTPLQGALEQAKALITAVERGDLYGALQLAADASDDAVVQRLGAVEAALAVGADAPDSPQAARIRAAQERLVRLRAVLTDPMRRLEYDFRAGQLRALDRIQRAKGGNGPSLETLRRVFNAVHPDKVERAAGLTRKAFAASQAGDLDGAIRAARGALEENPFFDELRVAVADWERARTRRR